MKETLSVNLKENKRRTSGWAHPSGLRQPSLYEGELNFKVLHVSYRGEEDVVSLVAWILKLLSVPLNTQMAILALCLVSSISCVLSSILWD